MTESAEKNFPAYSHLPLRFHTFTPLDIVESVTYPLPVAPFGDATALDLSLQYAARYLREGWHGSWADSDEAYVANWLYYRPASEGKGGNGELPDKINKWTPARKPGVRAGLARGGEDR